MQIQRVHTEHQPFPSSGGPHSTSSPRVIDEQISARKDQSNAEILRSAASPDEISSFLEQLRLLPDQNDNAVELARERYLSGALFSREVAESVATSPLKDFVF
ncbi:hypothetical protein [Thalassoglobus sp.]|uniref:hypothetical protein n=1 Tax=Thalassoglobus sp. TaxID=2795869 RepID=UPI003AA900DE